MKADEYRVRFAKTIAAAGALMWSLVAMSISAGCMSGVEAATGDVSPEGWSRRAELTYNNTDTLSLRNLELTLRHSVNVEPSEGMYVVGMIAPSGVVTETGVRMEVAEQTVHAGRLHETSVPIRSGVVLDEAGEWQITVTPLQNVRGVWSVSITLDKQNGQR